MKSLNCRVLFCSASLLLALVARSYADEKSLDKPIMALQGAVQPKSVYYVVGRERQCLIDSHLFGGFLEDPHWKSRIAPADVRLSNADQLDLRVSQMLQGMKLPALRFLAGNDSEHIDWTDLIYNAPEHKSWFAEQFPDLADRNNNVRRSLGLDEFLQQCEQMKSEPLLVTTFRDGIAGTQSLNEAAQHVAALVAYCNAPVGAKLPDGLEQWPALRARNGHPQLYHVSYFQIGNQMWSMQDELMGAFPDNPEERYCEALRVYSDAMRRVDPTIKIIANAYQPGQGALIRREVGERVDFLSNEYHELWNIAIPTREGRIIPIEQLSERDIWNAWVSGGHIDDETGLSIMPVIMNDEDSTSGYPLAITMWDWNCNWERSFKTPPALNSQLATGFGAAGIIHGLMRNGGVVRFACQSIWVDKTQDYATIALNADGQGTSVYRPSGEILSFYARHHGDWLLSSGSSNVPVFAQPYRMGDIFPHRQVAALDTLVTEDDQNIYLHFLNRDFETPMAVTVDLSALRPLENSGTQYLFTGRLKNEAAPGETAQIGHEEQHTIALQNDKSLRVTLPARSIACVEIPYLAPTLH